jgi:hypothetical protein
MRGARQRSGRSDHVFGVTAVVRDTGDLEGDLTGNKVTAATRIAVTTVTAVPADSDSLAFCPSNNAWANSVNDSGDFMSRDPRVLNARPQSVLGHDIAVTDSASVDLYAHMANAGLCDLAFNKFKRAASTRDLHCMHF